MSEPVFSSSAVPVSLAELIAHTSAMAVAGADLSIPIYGAAWLDKAGPGEITFLDTSESLGLLKQSTASACFITAGLAQHLSNSTLALVAENPAKSFAFAVEKIFSTPGVQKSLLGTDGINPAAFIHPEARLEQGVIVDPGAIIGPCAEIGTETLIGANSVIGRDVHIGRGCRIAPQVTISHALIGDRVILHPGARIGQSGLDFFAATGNPPGLAKLPTTGRVILQDGVEIGANATIDRGLAGDTVIGEGTRIGNLAHIAGNATIGRYCVIPAQAGLSCGRRLDDFACLDHDDFGPPMA